MSIYLLPPFEPPTPHPTWEYTVALGDATWRYRWQWFDRFRTWHFSHWDSSGTRYISQKKVVTDWFFLRRHTGRKPPGGEFILIDIEADGGVRRRPEYDDFGYRHQLFWITNDELAELAASPTSSGLVYTAS